ncbi:hypothetical protein F8M41_022990 [Gigaspora margarita]|uniref:Uncharacterized protein n=1 Tax=Gigaspora margarita TaxID=4874 RepID=A0A8H4B0Z1_GIGMA|nr:hypothetical protein F8M41_022990 [Gigaspora margarita]
MPNWPAPDLEVQYFLCILPNQYNVHPLGSLWQAFGPIKIDRITKAGCIFCMPENLRSGTAAVMGAHIRKCKKIPSDVQTYLFNAQEFQKNLELSWSS